MRQFLNVSGRRPAAARGSFSGAWVSGRACWGGDPGDGGSPGWRSSAPTAAPPFLANTPYTAAAYAPMGTGGRSYGPAWPPSAAAAAVSSAAFSAGGTRHTSSRPLSRYRSCKDRIVGRPQRCTWLFDSCGHLEFCRGNLFILHLDCAHWFASRSWNLSGTLVSAARSLEVQGVTSFTT